MRYFFIVNPAAGQGRADRIWKTLEPTLQARHLDYGYALTTAPLEATDMTRDVAEAGYDVVVGVGGDGTLQEIAAGLPAKAMLGMIPAGTGNDFSHNLDIPKDPAQALDLLLQSKPLRVDRCRVNGHPFLNVAGVGFDAKVAKQVKENPTRGKGTLPYLVAVFRQMAVHRNTPVTIYLDGEPMDATVLFVAVGNGAYLGGGMHICPQARLDDGLLDVCIAGDLGRIESLVNLAKIFRGTHIHHPKVTYLRARHVRIEGDDLLYQADGEPLGYAPVEFEIEPGSLTVLAPPHLESSRP